MRLGLVGHFDQHFEWFLKLVVAIGQVGDVLGPDVVDGGDNHPQHERGQDLPLPAPFVDGKVYGNHGEPIFASLADGYGPMAGDASIVN